MVAIPLLSETEKTVVTPELYYFDLEKLVRTGERWLDCTDISLSFRSLPIRWYHKIGAGYNSREIETHWRSPIVLTVDNCHIGDRTRFAGTLNVERGALIEKFGEYERMVLDIVNPLTLRSGQKIAPARAEIIVNGIDGEYCTHYDVVKNPENSLLSLKDRWYLTQAVLDGLKDKEC